MVTLTIEEYNKTKITKYGGFLCSLLTKTFGASPLIQKSFESVGLLVGLLD